MLAPTPRIQTRVTFSTTPLRFTPPTTRVSVDRITDCLATAPLCRELERLAVRGFAELTREQRFAKGAVIVTAGDPGDAWDVVRSGEVNVVLNSDDGREVILDVLTVGAHFGALSLIDGRPRSAHVVTTQPSSLLVLRRADFRRQVDTSPQVAWGVMVELSVRVRQDDGTIGSLVLLDVPGRVAKVLLAHAAVGVPATLVKPLTHQTTARLIGASRETVSRAMTDVQEKGLISVQRRVVTIVDRAALEARARSRG
jgi:CRP/FNR family transcriptional regulator, cyclic AMP receptor protein